MTLTDPQVEVPVYRDPTCTVHEGNQPCCRRDGRILTNEFDGDCYEQARLEATR